MSTQHMIPLWSAGALTVLWLCLLFKVSRNKVAARGYKGFWLAMLSWPMLLSSELWQLGGGGYIRGGHPVLTASKEYRRTSPPSE